MTNITLNHKNRTIELTKKFAAVSSHFGTDEYKMFQEARRDYPNYKVVVASRKNNKSNFDSLNLDYMELYRGLNYEYMEDYIKTHGSEEECEKNLAEFKEQKLISLCHSTSRRYPTIKKWFLAKYPEVMEFGIPDSAEENSSAEDNELAYEMPVKISA